MLSQFNGIAESKLAIINDSDSYSNVRSGKGKDFEIVTTIKKDEFFYCDLSENEQWIRISTLQWESGKQIEGYIHRSKVEFVEKLDSQKQKKLFLKILNKQKELSDSFVSEPFSQEATSRYQIKRKELELYDETKYTPVLDALPQFICSTRDSEVLQIFYSIMWSNQGSANEAPSYAIGKCFGCNSDFVIELIKRTENKEQIKFFFDSIEWGLQNNFYMTESKNSEYEVLKERLEYERKRCGL